MGSAHHVGQSAFSLNPIRARGVFPGEVRQGSPSRVGYSFTSRSVYDVQAPGCYLEHAETGQGRLGAPVGVGAIGSEAV